MKKLAAFMLILCGFLVGWDDSRVPQCNDEHIKKDVLSMAISNIKDQLVPIIAIKMGYGFLNTPPTYEKLASRKDEDSDAGRQAKGIIDIIDKVIAGTDITLKHIRINERYEDIRKSECAGDLFFVNNNTENISITYILQYTEDNEIYIEIHGLEQFSEPRY